MIMFCFNLSAADLIDTFVSFMENIPLWLSKHQTLIAIIIHLSIVGASALYTVKGSKIFNFFENIFKETASRYLNHAIVSNIYYYRISIVHFTVVSFVTWLLNESEAGVDPVSIATSMLFLC